jgi:signal transduction histidine kinase
MAEEKRRDSAGRLASSIALPEWSLRRKLALALTIPMLLAATFGGLRVQSALSESDNYSATAKQVTVLRPAAGYLAAAQRAIITSRQLPALDDPVRVSAIDAVAVAGRRLEDIAKQADLTSTQRDRLDSVMNLSEQLRNGRAYVSAGQAVSQVRQLQRGVTQLVDSIVAEQVQPEAKLAALQQALDGRVSLAMQQYMVNVSKASDINLVDLSAELGVEQVIIDRLGSIIGTTDTQVQLLNQQNAAHFGVVRGGGHDLGDAEAFEAYDDLTVELLNDIDSNLNEAATDARGLAIANAVVTIALLLAAIFLALMVSRMLLNPIRRVREGALEVANTRLPEMVAKIRAGADPGEIVPIPVDTHEEMGQLARAVDDMHRQAVHLASGEAHLRSQVGEMFSTLSRRNTSLINQQLGLIERLEKDEEDPNRLESLFRLDHLASRMRRTADSLMVLADAPTQAGDSDALALGDVFQAAMAGVQEYQRVQIESSAQELVNGSAAADVVHLMTELVDNALAFSPPTAPVKISTKQAGDSTIVEISDGGLGIAQDVLNSLNEDLRSGGEVTVETARRMGLLVVSRIATRHGITVSLARNARGGTTATVLLPPALLRGRQAPVQPKSRPGLAGLTPAKSVLPAAVTERLTNEAEPKKLPTRPEPAAPAAPAAAAAFAKPTTPVPAAPAAAAGSGASDTPAKPEVAQVGLDSISAAINAVTSGLPQRSPGATRSGGTMPGAPVGSTGGSLFQRLQANGTARAAQPDLPQREPATPTVAFGAIDATTGTAEVQTPETDEVETPQIDTPEVETLGAEIQEPVRAEAEPTPEEPVAEEPVAEEPVAEASALDPTPSSPNVFQPSAEQHFSVEPSAPAPEAPAESWVAAVHATPTPPPAPVNAYDLLDSRSPMPEATEDETPIFRALRSNWFTADADEETWTTSEIEAGWEAAEQVAEAPTLQLSESGLPMRRPGKRLVPGGVSPAPVSVDRDPEAIRARLAAHAAGVSRGRTAAVDDSAPASSNLNGTEEGPA